jgi:hypothetical protein
VSVTSSDVPKLKSSVPLMTAAADTPALEARNLYRFYRAGEEETLALRGGCLTGGPRTAVAVLGPSACARRPGRTHGCCSCQRTDLRQTRRRGAPRVMKATAPRPYTSYFGLVETPAEQRPKPRPPSPPPLAAAASSPLSSGLPPFGAVASVAVVGIGVGCGLLVVARGLRRRSSGRGPARA